MAIKYIVNPFHDEGLAPINTNSGGGITITEVANYSALPAASTVTGYLYAVLAAQGTKWLPGSLGGTYYPKGIYYSDGSSWIYQETPYESTEAQVSTGTNNDTFITPSKLTYFKTLAHTWALKQTFTTAPRFSSGTADQVVELDSNKDLTTAAKGTAYNKSFGTTAGTVAEGNDYRFGSCAIISGTDIDWNTATHFYKTLSANTTFTFSNLADAKTIQVAITNTASNYTVTWPTVDWGSAGAPTQRTGAVTDVYTFSRINGTVYGAVRQ